MLTRLSSLVSHPLNNSQDIKTHAQYIQIHYVYYFQFLVDDVFGKCR